MDKKTLLFFVENIPSKEQLKESKGYYSIEKYKNRLCNHADFLLDTDLVNLSWEETTLSFYQVLLLMEYNEVWNRNFYNCYVNEESRVKVAELVQEIINTMNMEEIKEGYIFNIEHSLFETMNNVVDGSYADLIQIDRFEQGEHILLKKENLLEKTKKKVKGLSNFYSNFSKKK